MGGGIIDVVDLGKRLQVVEDFGLKYLFGICDRLTM
jgi:hypothetical protein